jgi:hypothetical protein
MTTPHLSHSAPSSANDGLRLAFESELRTTMFHGLSDDKCLQLLARTDSGYVNGEVGAAWTGFQLGGKHAREFMGRPAIRKPGDAPADPARPNAEVVAASYEPTKPDEAIDWSLPLFDTDGYPHRLVELSSIQVVTKYSFAYVVWDRRTLEMMNNPGPDSLRIGNTPMSEAERERRRQIGAALLSELHAQAHAQRAAALEEDDDRAPAPRG